MKLWEGRFQKNTDSRVDDFNSSILFDCRIYRQDIQGSIAHVTMLSECNIIDKSEAELIIDGLNSILADLDSGALSFDPGSEDIHMFVESELIKRIGDTGKKLHTGRSRNDQVALDIRLYLREETDNIIGLIKDLIKVIIKKAEENLDTIMPGYTHLQPAQPITFGHHIMAYAFMLLRDIDRLRDCRSRLNISPLGNGALAGTTYPLNRRLTAGLLGMEGITGNSLDGVSDRDFCIELAGCLSILMMHLSRFSEEIIIWSSLEFKFIELDDGFATGSSIMPQKKNPDVAELVRGKSARVFGNLQTLLTLMKALPLAYNKDMQEDKEAIFDSVDTVKLSLATFTPMIDTMTVLGDNMRRAAAKGFINATDCADYLAKKGVPFRQAYKITGRLVAHAIKNNLTLEELKLEDYREYSELFEADIYEMISLEKCLSGRKVEGGPAREAVLAQISRVKEELEI